MNQLLAFPWIWLRTYHASRYLWPDLHYSKLLATSFQTSDELFCYRLYNRHVDNASHKIRDEKYGFATLKLAMKACDAKLIEFGYELVSEERAEKLRLLL